MPSLDENLEVAAQLREAANLLQAQGADAYRVGAWRRASETLEKLSQPLRALFDARGTSGLQELPGIGRGISSAIAEILITGRWNLLARLREGADHEAAHDAAPAEGERPAVETLLDVDREYYEKARAGRLQMIAPKRFNPEHAAWLPVLHTRRGPWHFTVLYSNTARAHELGRTRDWVVIYYYDRDHRERQCTVVTEMRGPLAGLRVVRGREAESEAAQAATA